MAVVHIIENLKTRILDKNGNIRFSFNDFKKYQNIENNISFRSSFKSEIVSNLTTASEIQGPSSPLGKGM